MESDLKLIQECGFNSFEEVVKKVNELVDVMRVGRARAEKYLERFTNEAKKLLKEGQKDKAKRELTKKKNHAERVKTIDTQLNIILEKLREVKNSTQMVQVLKAAKYCNNLLLSELGQKDLLKENNELNENQDLIDNDKEIAKYLEIISNSKKKKAKPTLAQNIQNIEPENNFPQPENNQIEDTNNFPQDNNDNTMNNNNTKGNNTNINNNNFGVNQNNNEVNNINNQNKVNNTLLNNIINNNNNNNMSNTNNQNNNLNNNNFNNNNFNNNNFNNNNFSNNTYTYNNYAQPKNPYDDIF